MITFTTVRVPHIVGGRCHLPISLPFFCYVPQLSRSFSRFVTLWINLLQIFWVCKSMDPIMSIHLSVSTEFTSQTDPWFFPATTVPPMISHLNVPGPLMISRNGPCGMQVTNGVVNGAATTLWDHRDHRWEWHERWGNDKDESITPNGMSMILIVSGLFHPFYK